MHLVNVRARTIQYSTETKARERIEKEKRLQEQYTNAKSTFETNLNASLLILLNIGIGIVSWRKVKGIIIRARARWHEYGEKSTKYLLNYEKRNHVKKHTRKLNINGSFTTDPLKVEWYPIYGPKSLFKFGESH